MAVAIFLRWDGFTREQYDAVRAVVAFERETAPGGLFHVAAIDEKGIRVTDVWETAEQFQTYLTERLVPAFAQMGITGQPDVEIIPVHSLITPGFTRI
jgi:hypothetical protein